MVEILIQGGDTEAATQAMRVAIKEIFEIDPLETRRGGGQLPGKRSFELLLVALAITPAIASAVDLASRSKLLGRIGRLLPKIHEQEAKTGAKFLIDVGDGKPIPAHEANRAQIEAALEHFAQNRKR